MELTEKLKAPKGKKKILVAVNALTNINMSAYMDYGALWFNLGRYNPKFEFHQFVAKRLSIDRFRNTAAKIAVQAKMEGILFVDDDMLLPKNVFKPLYDTNYDVIAGFTYIRGYPFNIMSFKFDIGVGSSRKLTNLTEADVRDMSLRDKKGVIPVDAIGTAVSFIRTRVLQKIPGPWFLTGPFQTEDIYFCMKAREYTNNRVTIGMHPDVICGHLLDPEVINFYTRDAHMKYCESFMNADEIAAATTERSDHGKQYAKRELESGFDNMPAPDEENILA